MVLITVRPTKLDRWVAKAVTKHTNAGTERAAQVVTWGADEHVLCLLAAGWWLYRSASSNRGDERATGEVASSSQDAQRQMQGQPTAAQQAQGAEPSAKMTDQNQPAAAPQGAEPPTKMADQGCWTLGNGKFGGTSRRAPLPS